MCSTELSLIVLGSKYRAMANSGLERLTEPRFSNWSATANAMIKPAVDWLRINGTLRVTWRRFAKGTLVTSTVIRTSYVPWQGCALKKARVSQATTFCLQASEKTLLFSYKLKWWAPRILWLGTFGLVILLRSQPWRLESILLSELYKCSNGSFTFVENYSNNYKH